MRTILEYKIVAAASPPSAAASQQLRSSNIRAQSLHTFFCNIPVPFSLHIKIKHFILLLKQQGKTLLVLSQIATQSLVLGTYCIAANVNCKSGSFKTTLFFGFRMCDHSAIVLVFLFSIAAATLLRSIKLAKQTIKCLRL